MSSNNNQRKPEVYEDPNPILGADGAPMNPQPEVWRAEWPWEPAGLQDPATFAELYRAATGTIAILGYDPYVTYHGTEGPGIAVGGGRGALAAAATAYLIETTPGVDLGADVMRSVVDEWVDALETRLGAVLYLTGQMHGNITNRDLAEVVGAWELHMTSAPYPTQDDVIAVLETAARLVGSLAGAAS